MIEVPDFEALAGALDAAATTRVCLSPLTDIQPIDLPQAYAIQAQVVARRLARGERIVGLKMGFTSEAMRRQMGVDRPNCGWLTDAMQVASGGSVQLDRLIHPRVEPEVALLLGRDLPWPASAEAVEAAVGACAPALEVVDSRFRDYRFRLEDNTADNSSAAGFVLGEWRPWPMDLAGLRVRLAIDGTVVEEGTAEAVLGHPLNSLREGARLAAEAGRPLRAGMLILTGGLTSAHAIGGAQRVEADFGSLGAVAVAVEATTTSAP